MPPRPFKVLGVFLFCDTLCPLYFVSFFTHIVCMINEFIFIAHVFCSVGLMLGALYAGKEALVCAFAAQAIFANLFIFKQAVFFGLTVTCADVYMVSGVVGLNLLQEYYGKEITQKAIFIGILLSLWYLIMAFFHVQYVPASIDNSAEHYQVLLAHAPRVILASHVVAFIVQHLDCFLYGRLKLFFAGGNMALRNLISISITQGLDTVLFSFLGLYGLVESMWDIIVMSFVIKFVVIAFAAPATELTKKFMK